MSGKPSGSNIEPTDVTEEFFNPRKPVLTESDELQERRENYWLRRKSTDDRSQKNATDAQRLELRLQERAEEFNGRWNDHIHDHVTRLEQDVDFHNDVLSRMNSLDVSNRDDQRTLHEIISEVYKKDTALPHTLEIAFKKNLEVSNNERKAMSVFEKMRQNHGSTRNAMDRALKETKGTKNAYMTGNLILDNKKIREKYKDSQDALSGDLLPGLAWESVKNEVRINQQTDPNYEHRGDKFVPKPGTDFAKRREKNNYDPWKKTLVELKDEARDWRKEFGRVNERANTAIAAAMRHSIGSVPLPGMPERNTDLERNTERLMPGPVDLSPPAYVGSDLHDSPVATAQSSQENLSGASSESSRVTTRRRSLA